MVKLTPKQTHAFDIAISGNKKVIVYGGAIRGGKTFWLILTFAYLCSTYPKSRWAIIRRSLPDLKRTTFVSLSQIMDLGLKQHVLSWNQDTNVLTFKNKSQLIFMSENYDDDKDLNRFKGLEINGIGFDEVNECQEATFNKGIERAGSWNSAIGKPPILILATLNPANNWVRKTIYDRYLNNELPSSWEYISAKITDNTYVSDEYKNSLIENMPSLQYLRFVEGNWDVEEKPENPFAYEFNPDKHVKPCSYNPELPVFISIDFNINPFCAGLAHHTTTSIRQFSEIEAEHGSIDKLCDRIRSYGIPRGLIRITGDAMGKRGDISQRDNATLYMQIKKNLQLSDNQFQLVGNPTHENSRSQVNAALLQLDIGIDPSCTGTIRDLQLVSCNERGEIIKSNRKQENQRADHLDHFRYRINTYFRSKIFTQR